MVLIVAGCGSSSDPGTGSETDPQTYKTAVNGTLSGDVTGAVNQGEVWAVSVQSASATQSAFEITATFGPSSASQLSLSSPAGITTATFISGVGMLQVPAVGTYTSGSSSGVCGGVALSFSGGSTLVGAYGASSAHDCDGGAQTAAGSWTLTLTSVKEVDVTTAPGVVGKYYQMHGTLTATLLGSTATGAGSTAIGTVSVSLTF